MKFLWNHTEPNVSLIVELETELARNTFHDFTLWISKPIKLYHVGLQSGCLQDQVADIQSNAFTHFHRLGNPKDN